MAKLPPMSRHAAAIHGALSEGREADAVDYAIKHLRMGESHQLFLNAVADLLTPKPKGKKGRPSPRQPSHWYEIGEKYEHLRYRGVTHEQAVVNLATQFSVGGEKTIERRVKYYREAKEAYQAHVSEMMDADNK